MRYASVTFFNVAIVLLVSSKVLWSQQTMLHDTSRRLEGKLDKVIELLMGPQRVGPFMTKLEGMSKDTKELSEAVWRIHARTVRNYKTPVDETDRMKSVNTFPSAGNEDLKGRQFRPHTATVGKSLPAIG